MLGKTKVISRNPCETLKKMKHNKKPKKESPVGYCWLDNDACPSFQSNFIWQEATVQSATSHTTYLFQSQAVFLLYILSFRLFVLLF